MAGSGKDTQHSVRRSKSFELRYGMKKSEWTMFKRDARKQGRGREIWEKMTNAYAKFLNNTRVVAREYYEKVRQK